jgi:hypothetical protein
MEFLQLQLPEVLRLQPLAFLQLVEKTEGGPAHDGFVGGEKYVTDETWVHRQTLGNMNWMRQTRWKMPVASVPVDIGLSRSVQHLRLKLSQNRSVLVLISRSAGSWPI